MPGFGSHTFSMINAANERVWVKFHFRSQQGIAIHLGEHAVTRCVLTVGRGPFALGGCGHACGRGSRTVGSRVAAVFRRPQQDLGAGRRSAFFEQVRVLRVPPAVAQRSGDVAGGRRNIASMRRGVARVCRRDTAPGALRPLPATRLQAAGSRLFTWPAC